MIPLKTSLLVCIAFAIGFVNSDFVITGPRRWIVNTPVQLCIDLTVDVFGPEDSLTLTLTDAYDDEVLIGGPVTLSCPAGQNHHCDTIQVPQTQSSLVAMSLSGTLAGEAVTDCVNITFSVKERSTYIQTDKYLYKPGQEVQFRVLSLTGANLSVDTTSYNVFLNTPSGTRIGQWLNVDNSAGLVHFRFELYDEMEEGPYSIRVNFPDGQSEFPATIDFMVEDYVLPRFEVTIETTKPILGSDSSVIVTVCARYTYGEPVSGNATVSLAAATYRTYYNLTQTKKISGCVNFTFSADSLLLDQNNCHIDIDNLQADALVVEEGTGVGIHVSNYNLPVHRKVVNFKEEIQPELPKPYLPIPIMIKTEYYNGTKAANEPMQVCPYYSGDYECKIFTTNANGDLVILLPFEDMYLEITAVNYPAIEKNWNDVIEKSNYYRYSYSYEKYYDEMDNSLSIYIQEKIQCSPGQGVQVNIPVIYVVSNQPPALVHIQVSSRGQIVFTGSTLVGFTKTELPYKDEQLFLPLGKVPEDIIRGSFNIQLNLNSSVSPKITILVWFSADTDGRIIADSKEVEITACLSHQVDFKWSASKVEPATNANLLLTAASNALCSIGVVDKSVELLTPEKSKLDIYRILQLTSEYETFPWDEGQLNLDYCLRTCSSSSEDSEPDEDASDHTPSYYYNPYNIRESLHIFIKAGYFVLSDLITEELFCDLLIAERSHFEIWNPADGGFLPGLPPADDMDGALLPSAGPGVIESEEEDARERKRFPETWLWLLRPLPSSGKLNESVTLPDTITEWVGSAVCVHPTEGVGISSSASITTFTTFFVELTLPSAAKRGETLPLIISVFNYMANNLSVKVTVAQSDYFQFAPGENGVRTVCVQSQSKSVVTVNVILTKIGDMNVTVDANATKVSTGSCSSESPPPPSTNIFSEILQFIRAAFTSPVGNVDAQQPVIKRDKLIVSLPVKPEGYPREVTYASYACSGLGGTSRIVASWDIAPPASVVEGSVRAWCTVVGNLMGPTVENLEQLIQLPCGCGEQNMLNFAPCVYILQYLVISNQLTPPLESKLKEFLSKGYGQEIQYRRSDGSYSAFGESDNDGSTWLTAFVVKCFIQALPYTVIDENDLNQSLDWLTDLQEPDGCFRNRGFVIHREMQGGETGSTESQALLTAFVLISILEGNYNPANVDVSAALACIQTDTSTHPYNLALIAYSLTLAKNSAAEGVLNQLIDLAIEDNNIMRWNLPDLSENTALNVEIAAYVLLSFVTYDFETYAVQAAKVVRWLSTRRNGQGGFVSTQDTVVALQAFAAYEKLRPRANLNMAVTLSATGFTRTFTLTNSNQFLEQRVSIPTLPAHVDVTVSGTGCALVQGVLRYNVLTDSTSGAFQLTVKTEDDPAVCDKRHISVCASYILTTGESKMAIMEINLVTGFDPVEEDLKAIVSDVAGNFKKYETRENTVYLYVEKITSDPACASFWSIQSKKALNVKDGTVSIYEFNLPNHNATQKFQFRETNCPAIA